MKHISCDWYFLNGRFFFRCILWNINYRQMYKYRQACRRMSEVIACVSLVLLLKNCFWMFKLTYNVQSICLSHKRQSDTQKTSLDAFLNIYHTFIVGFRYHDRELLSASNQQRIYSFIHIFFKYVTNAISNRDRYHGAPYIQYILFLNSYLLLHPQALLMLSKAWFPVLFT